MKEDSKMNKKVGKKILAALVMSLGLSAVVPVSAAEKPKLSFIGEFKEGLAKARDKKTGKFGYVNENWEFVIKPKFDSVGDFKDGFAIGSILNIKMKDDYDPEVNSEIINKAGKTVLKTKAEKVENLGNGIIETGGGEFSESPDEQFDVEYGNGKKLNVSIGPYRGNLAMVTTAKGKVGFVDKERKEVIKPIYDEIVVSWGDDSYFGYGAVQARKGEGKKAKYFYFDENGKELDRKEMEKKEVFSYAIKYGSAPTYKNTEDANKETAVALFRVNDGVSLARVGLLNKTGNFIVKPEYGIFSDYAMSNIEREGIRFSEGLLPVEKNSYLYYINEKFEVVFKTDYNYGYNFYGNLAAVSDKNGNKGFINKEGKEVVKPKYQYNMMIEMAGGVAVNDGMYRIQIFKNGRPNIGFINEDGKEMIKPIYGEGTTDFSDGVAWAEKGNKFGLIDKNGKMLIKPKYKEVKAFYNGAALVNDGKKWMLVNKKGKALSKKKYDEVEPFLNGLAYAKNKGNWGYVNEKGKEVVKVGKYDVLGKVTEYGGGSMAGGLEGDDLLVKGFSIVGKNGKGGIINIKGEEIIPVKYDEVEVDAPIFSEDFAKSSGFFKVSVAKNNKFKYGVLGKDGKMFLEADYDEIEFLRDDLIMARKGDKIEHINTEGEVVFTY